MTSVSDTLGIDRRDTVQVDNSSARSLFYGSMIAFLVVASLVTIAYYLIDKPAALFVHSHQVNRYQFTRWLTFPPEAFHGLAPVILAVSVFRMAWGRIPRWLRVSFAASLSILVASGIVTILKVAFGRYWPVTWINDNPSLIRDGAYGFYPFHTHLLTSFPSGHMAGMLAVVSVFWIAYPRWRWLYAVVSAAVMVGVTGMNYNFVGDNLGGAFLGTIIGAYTSHFCIHAKELTF
jgi:membrane-associated phospholipid phosphatase